MNMLYIVGISVAAVLFIVLLSFYRKWSTLKVRASYIVCSSPDCIRCNKYSILLAAAKEKLKRFERISGSKLSHLLDATKPSAEFQHQSQRPNVFYIMELHASPWWQESSFRNDVKSLENNWKLIHEEFLAVYEDETFLQTHWTSNTTEMGSWQTFYFYNQGQEVSANCNLCPITFKLLESLESFMPGCVFGNALFSVLDPHTTVTEHYGPTNVRIRCHLGNLINVSVNICHSTVCMHKNIIQCSIYLAKTYYIILAHINSSHLL